MQRNSIPARQSQSRAGLSDNEVFWRNHMMFRRSIVILGTLAATFATHAQQYPVRPVRVLIGYAAGSSTDIVGRVMTDRLGAHWKQTVIVENRGGAAGNVAPDAPAESPGGGYTLLFAQNGFAITAAAVPDLPHRAGGGLGAVRPRVGTPQSP